MTRVLTSAALLSLLLTAGCGGNNTENAPETPEEAAPPPAAAPADRPEGTTSPPAPPAAEPSPRGDTAPRADRPREAAPAPSKPADPAPSKPAEQWRELTLAQGTALPLELESALSSETAQVETPVRARVRQSVIVDGVVAIPEGAVMTGVVTQVQQAGRVKGRAQLAFAFNRLEAGEISEDVSTAPLTFVAEATKGEDATKIGAGAVGGAIVGGIIGGGKGAARGAAIGGAAGTGVVLATRGEDVTLASGTNLAASLAEPLTIRVRAR